MVAVDEPGFAQQCREQRRRRDRRAGHGAPPGLGCVCNKHGLKGTVAMTDIIEFLLLGGRINARNRR